MPLPRVAPLVLLAVPALVPPFAIGCGSSLPGAPDPEQVRQDGASVLSTNRKQCSAERPSTEPDLFGWDGGSRGKIGTIAEEGIVVVKFQETGCDIAIHVLPQCKSTKAKYAYRPYTERQSKVAEDETALYARFPIAVAQLRARLGTGRGVRADYWLAGIERIPIGTTIGKEDLEGSCDGATHVVSAIYRGTFAIGAGRHADLSADGTLFGGELRSRVQVFDEAGTPDACEKAVANRSLVNGCDAPLRIELMPIAGLAPAAPAPPPAVVEAPPAPAPAPSPAPPSAAPRPAAVVPPAPAPVAAAACDAGMAAIPGGSFMMGSNDGYDDEKPVHRVTLSPYCLDVTEVTVGAYARCTGCRAPGTGGSCNAAGEGKDDHPQNCVSWDDAVAYCRSVNKRLPTEAEWEFAARGGSEGREWPWGSEPPSAQACWDGEGNNLGKGNRRGTCSVKSYPATSFGLHDMAGNVSEWVADWYGDYPQQASNNYAGPASGSNRVRRGGSWLYDYPSGLRGALRFRNTPSDRNGNLGFRCARTR